MKRRNELRTRKDGLPREVSGSTTLSKIKDSGSVAIRQADRIQAPCQISRGRFAKFPKCSARRTDGEDAAELAERLLAQHDVTKAWLELGGSPFRGYRIESLKTMARMVLDA